MTTMLNSLRSVDLLFDFGDPLTKEFPLFRTPWTTLVLVTSYLYFVKVLGPNMMKNRKPYDLRRLMVAYNVALVAINLFLFVEIGRKGLFAGDKVLCEKLDYTITPERRYRLKIASFFLMTRFFEFGDTIFFVLRKKFSHVSTLHLFHHASVPVWVWFACKWSTGNQMSFFPFLNCFVHVIMYSYYALSAMGPQYTRYIWWKKYLTILQLAQFVLAFLHGLLPLGLDCGYPRWLTIPPLFNAVMFWFLFIDFYKKSYKSPTKGLMNGSLGAAKPKFH